MTTPTELTEVEPIPVIIKENKDRAPQDVRVMGCPRGVMKSQLINSDTADQPVMLAGKDLRRSCITIWFSVATGASNTIVYFGNKEDVQHAAQQDNNSGPGIWAASISDNAPCNPLVMHHVDEVYIALGVSDTSEVIATVITERWDDYGAR